MISRARNTRSCMPTRYPDGAARSHGFGTPDRTCLDAFSHGAATSYVTPAFRNLPIYLFYLYRHFISLTESAMGVV